MRESIKTGNKQKSSDHVLETNESVSPGLHYPWIDWSTISKMFEQEITEREDSYSKP